jgi:hypothetical protein
MRRARDDEIAKWHDDGWVLLDALIGAEEIDAVHDAMFRYFPRPEKYHANPERFVGTTNDQMRRGYPKLPETGPAFRPEQFRWRAEWPMHDAAALNRLFVHPAIVDFVERVLGTSDIRMYQAQLSAKYQGEANYEQPLHTDRNHSYLPPEPNSHVEMFLYLSDVDDDCMPTHFVDAPDATGYSPHVPFVAPGDPLYEKEHAATGPRGSLLAYRNDTFHRAVDLTKPHGARFLLNVSYKRADIEWIGYHTVQSRATHPAFVEFVEQSTPRELELIGFPPPGHPAWNDELLDATQQRYPNLDLTPWRNETSARQL